MSIPLARGLCTAALGVIAACGMALPAIAGGGSDCHEKAARTNVEGDGDGQLSAAEHAAGAQKRFEMMDANKDGRIAAAEIDASHGAESIAWAKYRMSSADKIKKLDANQDGALSLTEYSDGSQKMFTKLDADGDGYLSAEEMRVDSKDRMSALDTN
jgi:Ca2+-binding EF-hand superfamily protein